MGIALLAILSMTSLAGPTGAETEGAETPTVAILGIMGAASWDPNPLRTDSDLVEFENEDGITHKPASAFQLLPGCLAPLESGSAIPGNSAKLFDISGCPEGVTIEYTCEIHPSSMLGGKLERVG